MFNDSLTMDQCQRLVRKLAETAFPFQCAHGRYGMQCPSVLLTYEFVGRPSLVPLANVRDHRAAKRVQWDRLDGKQLSRDTE